MGWYPFNQPTGCFKSENKSGPVFIYEHGRGKTGILHSLWMLMVRWHLFKLNLFNQPIGYLIEEKTCTYHRFLPQQIYSM